MEMERPPKVAYPDAVTESRQVWMLKQCPRASIEKLSVASAVQGEAEILNF